MVLIIYLSFAFSLPFFHKTNCYKAEKDIIEKLNFAFRQALGKKSTIFNTTYKVKCRA